MTRNHRTYNTIANDFRVQQFQVFFSVLQSEALRCSKTIIYHKCVYCRMMKNKTQNTKYVNKIPCTTHQILIWSVTELRSHCGETIQHNGRRCPSMSHALPSSVHLYWCLLFFYFNLSQFKKSSPSSLSCPSYTWWPWWQM